MNTIEMMDGAKVEIPQPKLDPSDGQPPAEAVDIKFASRVTPRHRSWLGKIGRVMAGLFIVSSPVLGDNAVNISSAAAQSFKDRSDNTLIIEAAGAAEVLKAPLVVDRSWVEQNNQNVVAETVVTDPTSGDLIQQFTVLDNNVPYESHMEGGVLTARKALPVVPMGNVQSLGATLDGKTLIAGGQIERAINTGKVFLYSDSTKSWEDKTSKFPADLAGATQMMRLTGNTFVLNNAKFEGGSNQILFDVENGEVINVRTVKLTDENGNAVAVGRTRGMSLMSFNKDSGVATMVSTGSTQLLEGLLISNIDTKTGTGTVKQITQVKVADQANPVNLGYAYGMAFYTDKGQPHVKTINDTLQTIFDVNLVDLVGSMSYFGNILDDKGIANYLLGSLHLQDLRMDIDSTGRKWTRVAGVAGSSKVGSRAIVFTLEKPEDFVDLFPNIESNIGPGGMQQRQIKGQLVEDFTILNGGKAMLLPDNQLLFTDGGFPGKINAVAYLPALTKASSGW